MPEFEHATKLRYKDADGNFHTAYPQIRTDDVNDLDKFVANLMHPVGSIYITTELVNPSTLFGIGTWEQIKDTFLLAAGDTYLAGQTGGEATHTLTVDEMPEHSHENTTQTVQYSLFSTGSNSGYYKGSSNTVIGTDSTSAVGGSQEHNNMPPYLVVYVWKRTA